MTDATPRGSTTRRTVLASLLATLGAASSTNATRAERGQSAAAVDADNLVAGNSRFTVTIEGVQGSEVRDATVTIGGIAFAAVEVLERDPAVLAVDASNVVESESIASQDVIEVAAWVSTGDGTVAGTDESQVIAEQDES